MKLKVGKGDLVEVTTGSDKGKKGAVLFLDPKKMRVKVQGVKMMTHFDREKGKFLKEGFLDYSNIKLVEKTKTKGKAGKKKASSTAKSKSS